MPCSVLIFDPLQTLARALCRKLIDQGAQPHVFESEKSASLLLKTKKIDVVVMPFLPDHQSIDLCKEARDRGVPVVFMSDAEPYDGVTACWSVGGTHASSRHWGSDEALNSKALY
jgi:DNA-binding response OmpR family regulator